MSATRKQCIRDGKWYWSKVKTQRYCSQRCKNAAAQERLRGRAKEATNGRS